MTVCMFPGQGSQQENMGEGIFSRFPFLIELCGRILDFNIKKICAEDYNTLLNETRYTQPALFVVNALSYYQKLQDGFQKPEYFIGHSLGEYNALLAAGFFDFATGLRLVKKRAELMSKVDSGAMAAVIGLNADRVTEIIRLSNLTHLTIANYNTPVQTVISGLETEIDQIIKSFDDQGTITKKLNVSGAFHSPYMQPASEEFASFLEQFDFNDPSAKVLSNVDVDLYTKHNIKQKLTKQLSSSVSWVDIIKKLISQGEREFIEIGPGNVLTRLGQQILAIESEISC